MEMAALSMKIDSSDIVAATKNLDQFSAASAKAGNSAGGYSGSIAKLVTLAQSMDSKLSSLVGALDKIASASRGAAAANDNVAVSVARVGTATAAADAHVQAYQRNLARTGVSAGQQSAAMKQLGFQIGDVAASLGSGASALTVFAQQSGQVVQALGMMTNSTKGLLGFLGGIWGQILTAAVIVVGTFASKLYEAGSAAETAAKKTDMYSTAVRRLAAAQGSVSYIDYGNAQAKLLTQQSALAKLDKQIAAADGTRANQQRRLALIEQRDLLASQVDETQALLKGTQMRIEAQKKLDALRQSSDAASRAGGLSISTRSNSAAPKAAAPKIVWAPEVPVVNDPMMDLPRDTMPKLPDLQPMQTSMTRLYETMKEARLEAKSFFTDWIDGVRNGESVFKSFTNAISNSLNRLIDQMINQMLNQMLGIGPGGVGGMAGMGGMSGGLAGGAGAIVGGMLGTMLGKGIVSLFGGLFANGGAFGTAQRFANGGAFTNQIYNTPTLFRFANGAQIGEMGEAGPEAIMPLKRGPNGALGVQMHGGGKPSVRMGDVHNTYKVEGGFMPDTVLALIKQGGEATMTQMRRDLQSMIQQLDNDGTLV